MWMSLQSSWRSHRARAADCRRAGPRRKAVQGSGENGSKPRQTTSRSASSRSGCHPASPCQRPPPRQEELSDTGDGSPPASPTTPKSTTRSSARRTPASARLGSARSTADKAATAKQLLLPVERAERIASTDSDRAARLLPEGLKLPRPRVAAHGGSALAAIPQRVGAHAAERDAARAQMWSRRGFTDKMPVTNDKGVVISRGEWGVGEKSAYMHELDTDPQDSHSAD